jgi:hypothetical protein
MKVRKIIRKLAFQLRREASRRCHDTALLAELNKGHDKLVRVRGADGLIGILETLTLSEYRDIVLVGRLYVAAAVSWPVHYFYAAMALREIENVRD